MHTVWKGAISFGLVHVPVKLFSATEDKDISLRMLHKDCGSPISYVKECPVCETKIEWEDIVKGYEYEKGHFVTFEKEELEEISGERSKTIQILDFVALEDIDPVYFQKTYYLAPDQSGGGAYVLLLEALKQTGRIGIAKVSIRTKSSLAAIRIIDNCLTMETIFYPDEIRPVSQVPGLPEKVTTNDKELTMAKMLIEQLSAPFEPEKYTDDYRQRMWNAITDKIAGEDIRIAPQQEQTQILDLMAALQASLNAAKTNSASASDKSSASSKSKAKTKQSAAENEDIAATKTVTKPRIRKTTNKTTKEKTKEPVS